VGAGPADAGAFGAPDLHGVEADDEGRTGRMKVGVRTLDALAGDRSVAYRAASGIHSM
jgi:hypothetical protein